MFKLDSRIHILLHVNLKLESTVVMKPNESTLKHKSPNLLQLKVSVCCSEVQLLCASVPMFPVTKGPSEVGVQSFPSKLAWTCSSTHPNRWAQFIPQSSTSSEATYSFVLTIHKRPFTWKVSVISEILASGLCGVQKEEKREPHRKRERGRNSTNQL